VIIAGFDVATRTGIAIMEGDKFLHIESWRYPEPRPDGLARSEVDVNYEARMAESFRDHVRPLLVAHNVEHVAFEEPRTKDFERTKKYRDADGVVHKVTEKASSTGAMLRTFGLVRDLCGICHRLNIPAISVTADHWRKAFLGYSRSPAKEEDGRKYLKDAAMAQCRLLRLNVPNNDCAESVGVAWWLSGHIRAARLVRPGDLFEERAS